MFEVQMFEMFGPERTIAAFGWVDAQLSASPPGAPYASWWVKRRTELESRLPANVTQGHIPRSLPDHFKDDLSRFVLLEEVFYQLTHGPEGGTEMWTGNTLQGTLPPVDGGWGSTSEGQIRADDVLRWFRAWKAEMDSDLGAMISDVQAVTGAPDVEVAPGVRLRVNPDTAAASSESGPLDEDFLPQSHPAVAMWGEPGERFLAGLNDVIEGCVPEDRELPESPCIC